ncbi:MAG: TonB-dependent receptor [Mesonia sp.]|uniref:TonB-dependent receptor n=1 Tax=Mesonia sp. TaxID=1960830 RepID=UPI003241E4B4
MRGLTYLFIALSIFSTALLSAQSTNSAVISGQVTSASGDDLEGVNVILEGEFNGTTTDVNGSFRLNDISQGTHRLIVSYLGYQTQIKEVSINNAEKLEINFVLEESSAELEEVELTGKSEIRKINEQAYAVTSISTKSLLNSTADAQQVLDRVPGVRILQEGGLGSNYTFSLNGFKGNQVKFFLNGIPMDSFGSSFNLGNIPVNSIERVDVYNGVVPVWLGTDALGGAVNIITNQKNDYLDVSYSFGSFNTHKASVNGAYTNNKSGFTVRGNLNYNYSDNNYDVLAEIRDANGNLLEDNVEVERFHDQYQSATAQVETGFVETSFADQLLLGLIVSGDDNEVQTGATMRTVYGAVEVESESIIPTLKYKKQNLFFEGFDASLNASYNITQTRNIDTLTGVRYNWYGETFETNSENNGEQGLANLLEQDDNEFNSQLNLSYLFNEKHSLSFNHAFQHFKRDEFDEVNLSVNEYYLPKSLAKNVFGLSYKYKISKDWTASVFGKAYVLNVKASEQETNNVESTIPVSVDYSDIGYGMTTSYFLFKNLQLKASYEKAFRLPTAEEFFGDGLLVLANPNLKPEQSDNFNFGINFNKDLNENNQIEVGSTFIYRNAKDLIYNIVSVSSPTSRSGNLAETKALGVQGTFAYRWKDIFNLSANITYQDITDEADLIYNDFSGYTENLNKGARVPNTPYLFGGATAGFNFKNVGGDNTNLFFNYYYRFTQEYFLTSNRFGSIDTKAIIPQQSSHSAEIGYSIKNGKYNVSVEARNFTDEALYDKFRLQKPGRAFYLKLRYNL